MFLYIITRVIDVGEVSRNTLAILVQRSFFKQLKKIKKKKNRP